MFLSTMSVIQTCVITESSHSYVSINNVSDTDLVPILENVKCMSLGISRHKPSSEETRALVGAMMTRVDMVVR